MVWVEYFINDDPGYGMATSIPLNDNLDNGISFTIPLDDQHPGFKNLHIRALDEGGNWSTTYSRRFLVQDIPLAVADVDGLEYFFNEDPGFGNGVSVPITSSSKIVLNFTADLSDLDAGFHQLHVRSKDKEGRWSTTFYKSFYLSTLQGVAPDIISTRILFKSGSGLREWYQCSFYSRNQFGY